MAEEYSKESLAVVIGVIGIVGLLVASLGYALQDSGTYYEPEQINQFVLEQEQSLAPESPR